MRPSTLAEAYDRIRAGEPDWKAWGEFLDEFYRDPKAASRLGRLTQAPAPTGDARLDALAAAAAEYLSRTYRLPGIPDWCASRDRVLAEPWFTTDTNDPALRRFLAWSSPAEFRARNIFTEERPLRRKNSHLMPIE